MRRPARHAHARDVDCHRPPPGDARSGSPFDRASRLAALPGLLRERILVLDGAMGTMLQAHRFTEADFRGERFRDHPIDLRGNSDLLCLDPAGRRQRRSMPATSRPGPTS